MGEHALDDLAAYGAGALPPDRERRVRAHLAACAACAAEARVDVALDAALARERARPLGTEAARAAEARADAALDEALARERARPLAVATPGTSSIGRIGRIPDARTPIPWGLIAALGVALGIAVAADLRRPPLSPSPRAPVSAPTPLPPEVQPRDTAPDPRPGSRWTEQEV